MERHFNEEQVSEIIRLAADHQARHRPAGAPASSGVSESELMRVASELGIEPEALQAAISELGAGARDDTGTINSVERVLERSVEGELSPDQSGIVLEEFTPMESLGNQTISFGNSLTYRSFVGLAQCNVNVSARGGKTTLRIKSNAFAAALPTFLPAIFISLFGNLIYWKKIAPPVDDGILFAILIPAALLAVAYFGFRKLVRYSNSKILALADRTAAKLAESADHIRARLVKPEISLPEVEENVEQSRIQ